MQIKCLYIIFIFTLSLPLHTEGHPLPSKSDTIYTYETKIVYDTIYVYDTIKISEIEQYEAIDYIDSKPVSISLLEIDTVLSKANLLIISEKNTATIPINSIILNENTKNLKSMKKLSFFGVVLFTFQSMSMAQTNIGISMGGGMWWTRANNELKSSESNLSGSINSGVYVNYSMFNKIAVQTEINYNYLKANSGYMADVGYSVYDNQETIITFTAEENYTNFHQFSIPVKLYLIKYKLMPYIGMEYSLRYPTEAKYRKRVSDLYSFGVSGGLKYSLWKNISMAINYYHGLTTDVSYSETKSETNNSLGQTIVREGGNYNWKNSRLGISIYYTLWNSKAKK